MMLRLLAIVATVSAQLVASDRNAMFSFCQIGATNVQAELGWCVDADPCTWLGVTCDGPPSALRIVSIIIANAPNVGGVFPSGFRNLAALTSFEIEQSKFSGFLAPQFFNTASALLFFSIRNSPTLGFDASLLRFLVGAQTIKIVDTRVAGELSFRGGDYFVSLLDLEISYSQLAGIADNFFSGLGLLQRAVLKNNRIADSVPSSVCGAPALATIDLSNNRLRVFPPCLTAINPLIVKQCNLRNNYFCTGPPNLLAAAEYAPCLVDELPNNVRDVCRVCGGTNDCLDCRGTNGGTFEFDVCGECGGDGSTCLDCAGVPAGMSLYDACDVCDGDGSTCRDCNNVPNGPAVYDVCDVCNGDGTSCIDCNGVLIGTSVYDVCDVCDGDGTGCQDCAGVPFGTDVIDECDECGGLNLSCADCAGVPNGTAVYDRCDVCNGDGSLCGISGLKHQSSTLKIWTWVFIAIIALLTLVGALWAFSCCPGVVAITGLGAAAKGKKKCRNLKLHNCALQD